MLPQEVLYQAGPGFEASLESSTGVYIGCMYTEYLDGILHKQGVADANSNAIIGHGLSFLVGRLSYTFGFQVRIQFRAINHLWNCSITRWYNAYTIHINFRRICNGCVVKIDLDGNVKLQIPEDIVWRYYGERPTFKPHTCSVSGNVPTTI